ncbi:MAG: hypothetical protein HYZ20_01810 [Burkholderiales bacterium]|nr:hypothetical protein [Burkholderiales bacterium]
MSPITAIPRPARRGAHLATSIAVGALLAAMPPAASAAAQTLPFEATTSGEFWVAGDVGSSPLFVVQETGDGSAGDLGAMHYQLSVVQNLARPPAGCGPSSSTGTGGVALLTLADGALSLQRSTGSSCFSFPLVQLDETWVVGGGSGRYQGASGKLVRRVTGDVRDGSATGSLSGSLKLPH